MSKAGVYCRVKSILTMRSDHLLFLEAQNFFLQGGTPVAGRNSQSRDGTIHASHSSDNARSLPTEPLGNS